MANKIKAEDFNLIKEDKKNFKQSKIERSGLTSEFTIEELEKDLVQLEKAEGEAKAQVNLSTAAITNVERNHPFVGKLDEKQLATASYLYETKQVLNQAQSRVTEIKAAKKKYKEVLETVYTKFGYVKTDSEPEKVKIVYKNV